MSKQSSQYRLRNRSSYGTRSVREDTAEVIKSNTKKIEEMKRSNLLLQEELEHERKICERSNKKAEIALMELQQAGSKYAQKISEELRKKEVIAQHISECEAQIENNRKLLKNPENEYNSSVW